MYFPKKIMWMCCSLFLLSSNAAFAQICRETLEQAFTATVNTSPNLRERIANQQGAWYSYMQLHAGYFPTIALAYNVGRGKGISVSPQTLEIGYTVANIQHKSVTLSQLIYDGGALSGRVRSAMSKYDSARFETMLELNQLALRTTAAYLAVLRSRELEDIALQNVNAHKHRLEQSGHRYKGGVGTISEYSLAQERLNQAQLIWQRTQLELANANAVYLQVIGHPVPAGLKIPDEPSDCIPRNLAEAESMALETNPAIHVAKAQIQSARHEVESTKAVLYFPNVTLQLNTFRDNNLNGIEQRTVSMQGYLAFTYNIFTGGADLANVRKSVELVCASQAALETKRREISLALEQTWNELEIAKRDILILKNRLASTTTLVDAFVKEMQLGRRSLLDVMNTENELYNTKAALVDARYKIKIDTYALLANAGKLADYLCNHI